MCDYEKSFYITNPKFCLLKLSSSSEGVGEEGRVWGEIETEREGNEKRVWWSGKRHLVCLSQNLEFSVGHRVR